MKWAELITVQSTESSTETLTPALQDLMGDVVEKYGTKRIQIYHRERIETDFCIILSHDEGPVLSYGSQLGLRITSALRAFGMVNHSVWSEIK
jgi:hypothetical protein